MTKELVGRVEKIESASDLDATDREMLQALNARLAVCDCQAMRLVELRDVEITARSTMKREPVEPEVKSDVGAVEHDIDERFADVEDEDHGTGGENDSDSASASETHSEYSDESEIDKNHWPLLYRIMDVDPETLDNDIEPMLNK